MAKKNKIKEVNEIESPWYYFYSTGCGFCKKIEPFVDELNEEGHNILKLDLSVPDNQNVKKELDEEYNSKPGTTKCGTPWLINAETGKQVCGYREKDIIEKWLAGEDVPPPPRPKSPMPRLPFKGVTKKEENKWKKEYKKWVKENSHLTKLATVKELLDRPRPYSDPPKFPNLQSTEEDLKVFKKDYDKWAKDNSHMPNLQSGDMIIARLKNAQRSAGGVQNKTLSPDQEARLSRLEQKLDKLIKHLGVK